MNSIILKLSKNDCKTTAEILPEFLKECNMKFSFPELGGYELRKEVWLSIYNLAISTEEVELISQCFSAIRILSRDKTSLDELLTEINWLDLINSHSTSDQLKLSIEAVKCFCNLVFNSHKALEECSRLGTLTKIIDRVDTYTCYPIELKIVDMKLAFIMTTLSPDVRKTIADNNGIEKLCRILPLSDLNGKQIELVNEILKALYNLTIESDAHSVKLADISRLLLVNSEDSSIHNNVVNLLTNVKYYELDVLIIDKLLSLLEHKFTEPDECLMPILTVFLRLVTENRDARKYLRSKILPPLREVHEKPEDGTSLRNHLCRLLTTPSAQLRDLAAEFLFTLCKKNVGRMIKYTGYGNAAGLFARKGLLGGKNTDTEGFSSEDEDSETEEYAEYKHGINPVVGCYEPPKPNAMSNMTEEQKEYEAMKLVELMDSMTKKGSIRPCTITNGKLKPIDHVLELREGIQSDSE